MARAGTRLRTAPAYGQAPAYAQPPAYASNPMGASRPQGAAPAYGSSVLPPPSAVPGGPQPPPPYVPPLLNDPPAGAWRAPAVTPVPVISILRVSDRSKKIRRATFPSRSWGTKRKPAA